jgi:short subunit dehydrogenase-like uncharacterized protein
MATRYNGKLVASRAKGSNFVLAGRSAERVKAVAKPLGLPWRAFDVGNEANSTRASRTVVAVLCAAGPFFGDLPTDC